MNPHQMAKAQCDCYNDGLCLGITFDDQMRFVRFRPENSKCLLVGKIERCAHFESSVLPYKPDHRELRTADRLKSEWSEGTHEYRMKTGAMSATQLKLCPKCKERRIPTRYRLCEICRGKNRRETISKANRNR